MSEGSSSAPMRHRRGILDSMDRDGTVVFSVTILLSALAWAYLVWMPVAGVARGVLARGYAMHRPIQTGELSLMDVSGWAASLPWFALTWVAVVVAMMLPVVAPDVAVFDRWRRSHGRSAVTSVAFAAGFLMVWAVLGVFVFAAIVALDVEINTASTALRVGSVVLLAAGAYQLTRPKVACLARAQSPADLLDEHGDEVLRHGVRGALQVGLWHGGWSLGCWGGLMAVLVALGVLHLGWMAAVTVVMLAEKLLPGDAIVPRAVGGLLLLAGAALLVTA